ncbi:MAG: response regulator transcription factor [Candidatus Nanopelagicales bacterium]|nr:response regulator transcription factor [Candidatus Nanopelagicales bacterium]
MQRTVMIVEDDAAIRMVLRTNLEDEGYRVLEAVTAEQGLVIVLDEAPDVVLVDLRLPGIHGLDLVRSLRATSQVPIIIVTAQTDSHDVVAGLEAGADDYVTKPFVAKELMARIRTQLRRATPADGDEEGLEEGDGENAERLVCGPIELRMGTAEVLRLGEPVPVSRIEFYVLAELIGAKGKVLSRDHLLRKVWGYGNAGDGRVVDNLIYRLRNKIEQDPANPELLLTVRGFGYRMKA